MTNELIKLTLSEAREGLKRKDFTSKELTKAYLERIEASNHNAYITLTAERALEDAAAADARLAKGEAGLMEGIPLGMKDLFCTKGIKTTAASNILKNFIPPYESTVSLKLQQAGSVLLGKTNLDEFAMGSTNTTSAFGNVLSPWTLNGEPLTPGGSSGGSSAAVAAGLALCTTGTDTGGSIRQPAAFTGTVGIKPTYGRCSRYGIVAFASSLDQAGPITRTVRDAAIMLEAMSGHDPKDSTSANVEVPNFEASVDKGVKGLKVGIPKEYQIDGMPEEIIALWNQAKDWLKSAGAEIVEISLPNTKSAMLTYYIIAPAEASSNLARYDGVRFSQRVEGATLDELYENSRSAGFGDEVKRRIMIGTYVLSAGHYDAYYIKAQKVRRLIKQDFDQAFEGVDVILTPTTPTAAFGLNNMPKDPLTIYMNDVFAAPANMAGIPGMSVPAGFSKEGLPLGVQLLGPRFGEEKVFQAGRVIEEAAKFDLKTIYETSV